MSSKNLLAAKIKKNDEYYTLYEDIEKEISHYTEYLYGKTVYCNCDNPYSSNFVKYFIDKFNQLHLKKLIASCYNGVPEIKVQNLFYDLTENNIKAYKLEFDNTNNLPNVTLLKGNGDFRSAECIELLKTADVIVTNPPFSLFRQFINLMDKYGKDYILLGNLNAVTYKNVFYKIPLQKIRLGYNSGTFNFNTPNENKKTIGLICWYTTFAIEKNIPFLHLTKKYSPEKYSKFDNYNAINIDSISDIPYDYLPTYGGGWGVNGSPNNFSFQLEFKSI